MPALLKQRRSEAVVGTASIPFASSTPALNPGVTPRTAASPSPSLRCPRCRSTLVPIWDGELQCTRPKRPHSYPIIAGIPDLRTVLDADITVARERADARVLAEMLSRTPEGGTPDSDVALFAEERAGLAGNPAPTTSEELLADWEALDIKGADVRMILDVGCGSGTLLEAAARRWPVCVGVDHSLRRLVIARHRLNQAGVRARLVCASMDALPFADGIFDRVIAESVLELAPRKERALREWNRMLSLQGSVWISTSNRWSVTRDPLLGIPALSWLPMQLVDLWAKWHGVSVPQRAMVGTKRLRHLLEETGYSHVRLGEPGKATGMASAGPSSSRKSLYDLPIVRELATRVRPMLIATAGASQRRRGRVRYDRYVARLAL